jgi:hypothetical protein
MSLFLQILATDFTKLDTTSCCTRFQNLHQMSSSLLEMLDDPDVATRELALSLLAEILEKHVSFFFSFLRVVSSDYSSVYTRHHWIPFPHDNDPLPCPSRPAEGDGELR